MQNRSMIGHNQTNLKRRLIDTYDLPGGKKIIVFRLEQNEVDGSLHKKIVAVYLHEGKNGLRNKVGDFTNKKTIQFTITGYPGCDFYLNEDGSLVWTTQKKPLVQEDLHQIPKCQYPDCVLFTNMNNQKGIDLSYKKINYTELNNYYRSLYNNLCCYCEKADVKKRILSTLFGLQFARVTKLPYNGGPINNYLNNYQDFLNVITQNLPNNQKIYVLNKVIQYGVATEGERDIANNLLNFYSTKQSQQQQYNQSNQNIINQYQNNKKQYPINNIKNYNINYVQQMNKPTEQQVNWTKWCQLQYPYQNYIIKYGNSNGQNYFSLYDVNKKQTVLYNRCNTPFKFTNGKHFCVSNQGDLFTSYDGYSWQQMNNVGWQNVQQQNYQNNFNNMNKVNNSMINQNNPQEVLLGTFSGFGYPIKIFGYKTTKNITYTRIQLPDGNFATSKKFQFNGHQYSFQATNPPNLFLFFNNDTYSSLTWIPAGQQMNNMNNNFMNNMNNFNNLNNNNYQNSNFGMTQPTNAAAVEQGQVGVYDEDTKLLMDVLKNGEKLREKLKDNGFVINPEDGGGQSISKNGKKLFVGKMEGCQLKEGKLNVKFKDGKATEYYVGNFKDNLFESTQGIYVFEERYNTGIPEKFEGSFSKGKPHGQVKFYDANGLSSEYEYDHGKIISQGGFRSMQDTDVIVFDAAVSFEDAYTDRYANNFHIVAQEVYDKKKEQIFGQRKDDVKMPTANEKPNEKQQKMMEFIQKYILVKEPNGDYQSDYIAKFCYDSHLIALLNEHRIFIDSSEKMEDFVAKMKKEFFGNDKELISDLIGKNNELREKWLCFVVDKIGMHAFNEMYAMQNLNHFVEKIKRNGNKKLKVVFSNHGSSSLHLFQDDEFFSAEWVDNLMATIKGLKRDTYVVNQSCYGGEKLDKKSFSKRIFDVVDLSIENKIASNELMEKLQKIKDLSIDNYKTNKIASNELMEKLQKIKEKYKYKLGNFKQLMDFKNSISFVSNYKYKYNTTTINCKPDDDLKKFMLTLFGIQKAKGNIMFTNKNEGQANIHTEYLQKDGFPQFAADIEMSLQRQVQGGCFLTSDKVKLYDEIFNTVDTTSINKIYNFSAEFHQFYNFLHNKMTKSEANKCTIAQAEQEFIKNRLEEKCAKMNINYNDFEDFEKDFKELIDEDNKTYYEWKNKFKNKIGESISEFLDKKKLLDPMDKLEMDFEKKMIELEDELEDNDEIPSDEQIKKITNDICEQLKTVGENISKNINNVLQEINDTPNYKTFIQKNFGSLYNFCANNKDILFENIFEKGRLLSKDNLIQILTAVQDRLNMNITTEIKRIIKNKHTLKNKLQLLKEKGFGNTIVYSKNLSNKMIHYTNRKQSQNGKSVSNSEHYMMYYIIDNDGKMKPLVKDVDGFKKSLEEFEAELEKQSKTKREGQNFGEAFHDPSTISKVFNKSGLEEYIKEAKANKNILLHYRQPNKLQGRQLTIDIDETQHVNNNNPVYNQASLIGDQRQDNQEDIIQDELCCPVDTNEKYPKDNIKNKTSLYEGQEGTNKINQIPVFSTNNNQKNYLQ